MKKLTLLLICLSNLLVAQESFVIKDVRLFDGEIVKEKTSVLIENGEISKVSPSIKGRYTIVDGAGKTLIPAMTNAHVHAWSILSLKQAAKAGVLNVLDMHGVEMMQNMMKQYNDSTHYANYVVAGAAATVPEGHGTQFGFPTPTLTKPEEASDFIQRRVDGGADFIKIILEPWKKTLTPETVYALINEAHKRNKIAVVHVSKMKDALKVLSNKADGLVHIWRDTIMPEASFKNLVQNNKFFVIPTLLTNAKGYERAIKRNPKAKLLAKKELFGEIKRLHDAGVTLLAGTDPPNFEINYGTDLHKEIIFFVEAGLSELEALKAATSAPAAAFSLKKQGFIKEGFMANMVLIDGNPLENIELISKINSVWKAGKKVKLHE